MHLAAFPEAAESSDLFQSSDSSISGSFADNDLSSPALHCEGELYFVIAIPCKWL